MSKLSKLLSAALVIFAVAGCEGTEQELPGLLEVRFLNASPDSPLVNIHVEGLIGELDLTGINFREGSEFNGRTYIPVRFGDTVVEVESVRPEGNKLEFQRSGFALTDETNYEIIFVGKFADSTLDTIVISNPQTDVSAGNFRLQIAHASPDTADVVVYVTAPDAMLDASPSLGPVGFKSTVAPMEYPSGNYQIRISLASDPLVAVYDSGPLNLAAGADLVVTIINNTTTGDAPVSVIIEDDVIRDEFLDINTPADLRFVNVSPDAPAVDVLIDDATPPAFAAIAFTEFSDYLDPAMVPGTYNVRVVDSPAPGMVEAITADPVLAQGVAHTVFATGLWANMPLAGIMLVDEIRPVATEARLRVVNVSTTAGTFDLYIEPPGTAIDSGTLIRARLTFGAPTTTYISLVAGDYQITITEAADPTQVIIGATPVTVVNGGIYTAVAVDSVGGITPAQWILMDDFAP